MSESMSMGEGWLVKLFMNVLQAHRPKHESYPIPINAMRTVPILSSSPIGLSEQFRQCPRYSMAWSHARSKLALFMGKGGQLKKRFVLIRPKIVVCRSCCMPGSVRNRNHRGMVIGW